MLDLMVNFSSVAGKRSREEQSSPIGAESVVWDTRLIQGVF